MREIYLNLVDYFFQNDMKLNHFLKPLVKKVAKKVHMTTDY